MSPDGTVHVGVDEVEPRAGAPVAQEPRLDVLELEGLAQQRVVEQVDLSDGQVVGGAPVRVDASQEPLVGHGHTTLLTARAMITSSRACTTSTRMAESGPAMSRSPVPASFSSRSMFTPRGARRK